MTGLDRQGKLCNFRYVFAKGKMGFGENFWEGRENLWVLENGTS